MTGPPGAAGLDETTGASAEISSPPAVLDALFVYFVVALALGALLEPVDAFFIRAGADPLMAILSQATVMLLVLLYAAGWVVEGFRIPSKTGPRLAVGAGAMALLLATGVALAFLILGIWPGRLARQFANLEGAVIGGGLLLGALLPVIRVRGQEM